MYNKLLQSKTVPLWKVKREFQRLKGKAFGFAWLSQCLGLNRIYYDLFLASERQETIGAIPYNNKVAIYLIFPTHGVLASHLAAIEDIRASGYAPLVVSNIFLSAEDREALKSTVWKIIERMNFGYDFGGYRDGIMALEQLQPRHLALLNDSVWFPTSASACWLTRAEDLGVDFAGAVSNYGSLPPRNDELLTSLWTYDDTRPKFHYCSFALLMGPRVLLDAEFYKFWRKFGLTNDKRLTIQSGEIGLSQFLIKKGFSHAETYGLRNLDQELTQLNNPEMLSVLSELIVPDTAEFHSHRKQLLRGPKDGGEKTWRAQVISLLIGAAAWNGAAYTLVGYRIASQNFPFLKKSLSTLHADSPEIVDAIAQRITTASQLDIVSEVKMLKCASSKEARTNS